MMKVFWKFSLTHSLKIMRLLVFKLLLASFPVIASATEIATVLEGSTDMGVKIERYYIKDAFRVEGVGLQDLECARFTFFENIKGDKKTIGKAERSGRYYISKHGKKEFEWAFTRIDKTRFLVVGYAKGEEELICEYFDLTKTTTRDERPINMSFDQFRSIGEAGSIFTFRGIESVEFEKLEDVTYLLINTTGGGKSKVEFDPDNRRLLTPVNR